MSKEIEWSEIVWFVVLSAWAAYYWSQGKESWVIFGIIFALLAINRRLVAYKDN